MVNPPSPRGKQVSRREIALHQLDQYDRHAEKHETDEKTSPTQLPNAAEVLPCLCVAERNDIFRFFPAVLVLGMAKVGPAPPVELPCPGAR